jgi:two-component system sensor histidine kinase UhpB
MRDRILRAPLVIKLLGASLLIALTAGGAAAMAGQLTLVAWVGIALVLSFALNTMLVRLALRPLDALQRVAEAVSKGEAYVRVAPSPIADHRVERLGTTFNRLLDTLSFDRQRIHQLIQRSLGAREAERLALSQQLRDATAQQLSALTLQLAVAERAFGRPDGRTALQAARDISSSVLDDVRDLADAIYPGLVQELGLPAALAALAARAQHRSHLKVSVEASDRVGHLSCALVTAMYHVAEEAVRNAEQHAHARSVWIRLARDADMLRLEVIDDGDGFDVAALAASSTGVGLFQARELLAHAHGHLEVQSSPSQGTRVVAVARLDQGDTS